MSTHSQHLSATAATTVEAVAVEEEPSFTAADTGGDELVQSVNASMSEAPVRCARSSSPDTSSRSNLRVHAFGNVKTVFARPIPESRRSRVAS